MSDAKVRVIVAEAPRVQVVDARPPEFSDEALALLFAQQHAEDLRWVNPWGKWLHWDGCRWKPEDSLLAFDKARAICRTEAARVPTKQRKLAAAVASSKTVAAIERLAKADRRLAAFNDQWDLDPLLLNTPDGTVDLSTGELRSHRKQDHLTKVTAVTPGGECPLWLAFLDRAMGGDGDLVRFIQRVAGYSLTGLTIAHALFFFYGTGRNGKGVLLGTLAQILGDYSRVAPVETFIDSRAERHPTDLAMLRGARLVSAQETEQGRAWAESKIKALTGGDKITARFMRMDYFEFIPQFKLIVAGNHKPGLKNVDEAIRRRLHLVPFTVTIPEDEVDPDLPEKLRAEWPGILQWAIDGCLDWRDLGLAPPAAVRDATAEYMQAEDAFALWIGERCSTEKRDECEVGSLFKSWVGWADRAGEVAGSMKRFSQALQDRGFSPFRNALGKRAFKGIRVLPQEDSGDQWRRE